jgi:pilus assembly protein Flp/PilA
MEAAMKNLVSRVVRDESGATAIEYGLFAAGIAVVIITAVQLVGSNLSATFQKVASKIGPTQ